MPLDAGGGHLLLIWTKMYLSLPPLAPKIFMQAKPWIDLCLAGGIARDGLGGSAVAPSLQGLHQLARVNGQGQDFAHTRTHGPREQGFAVVFAQQQHVQLGPLAQPAFECHQVFAGVAVRADEADGAVHQQDGARRCSFQGLQRCEQVLARWAQHRTGQGQGILLQAAAQSGQQGFVGGDRSKRATLAPTAAKWAATWAPMPLAAPDTAQTRPVNPNQSDLSLFTLVSCFTDEIVGATRVFQYDN